MKTIDLRQKIAKIVDSTKGVNDLQQALKEWLEVPNRSGVELVQTTQLLSAVAVRLSKGDQSEKERADILRAWVLRLRVQNRRITI
jgi:hypothetical protein